MKKIRYMIVLGIMMLGACASATLIASESFSTGNGADYTTDISFSGVGNSNIVTGTTGFSSGISWIYNTACIEPSNDVGAGGLTHVLLRGTSANGLALLRATSVSRHSSRDLSTAPAGPCFYMSGLVSMGGALANLDEEQSVAIGMGIEDVDGSAWNTTIGMHLGVTRTASGAVYLAAFAAGNTYTLGNAITTAQASQTQMIVCWLEMNTAGSNDTLTAWIAQQGETNLTKVLEINTLNIIDDPLELSSLMLQVTGAESSALSAGIRVDEFRFGTMLWNVCSVQQAVTYFWVSTAGNDTTGNGTASAPWATIKKAKEHIQENNLNENMMGDITVNIAEGSYFISSPVTFEPSDSGENGHHIIYRAVDGPGTVILVGSPDINGWEQTQYSTNIWKIYIGLDETVDSVFENGVRGQLARSPNLEIDDRYPVAHAPYSISVDGCYHTSGYDRIEYEPGEYSSVTNFTETAKMVWWVQSGTRDWGMGFCDLYLNHTPYNLLYFDALSTSYAPSSGERYFIQGVQSLLDAPGEFYYSPSSGWLYYYPRSAGNPDDRNMRVPLSYSMLISVQGGEPGIHAHHIKFEGLTLNYISARADRGAINLEHTDHIEVRDCHILNVGRYAVQMRNDNSHNLVYGCWIEHCGVGGVLVRNDLQRADCPDDKSEFNIIANCKIHDLGEWSVNSSLTAGVCLLNTSDCDISNCEVYNSARYAISLRGHWSTQWDTSDNGKHFSRNNYFNYVRAVDCMQDSGDGGVVHAAHCNGAGDPAGTNNINYWNQILASGAYADPSMLDWAPNGIFFDHPQSCLYQSLSNIKIGWTPGSSYRGNNNPVTSQTTSNVNFYGTFNESLMNYSEIGLKADFPFAYDTQEELVCDDHTVDYSESVGWVDSAIGGRYKGDARYYIYAGNTNALAQWVPSFPFTRKYEVSIWRTAPSTGASTCAPYEIYYQNGVTNITLNQQSGSGWVSVGTYPFIAGRDAEKGSVKLYANTVDGLAVRADAVKFTEVDLLDSGALGEEKGWWGFEQTAADGSGYDHDGISQNIGYSTWSAAGDYSAYFNSTGYVSVVDHSDLDIGMGDFSISLWFRRTSDPAENLRILSKGAQSDSDIGYCIYGSDTGVVFALSDGASRRALYGTHTAIDEWNRIVVNISRNGYMKLYINGSLADEMNISDWKGVNISNSSDLKIGRSHGGYNWVGRIDEVALFQRLLADPEIF